MFVMYSVTVKRMGVQESCDYVGSIHCLAILSSDK